MTNMRFRNSFSEKFMTPVKNLLLQGTSPRNIALAISGSAVLGIFPVIGSTTLLCLILAFSLRLNLPLVQLVNFSVYPLQLTLIIPFMKMGEYLFRIEKFSFSLDDIYQLVTADILNAISVLWNVTSQGIGAWMITAPFLFISIYFPLYALLRKFKTIRN
jgi:uncharacterized protein (DUF2062 family)